jgi:hypothetical protein
MDEMCRSTEAVVSKMRQMICENARLLDHLVGKRVSTVSSGAFEMFMLISRPEMIYRDDIIYLGWGNANTG